MPFPAGRGAAVQLRCGACGIEFVGTTGRAPPRHAADPEPAPRTDRVFLDEAGVRVTEARFTAPGFSLPVGDVLWLRLEAEPGHWRVPWVGGAALAGALVLFALGCAAMALAFDPRLPAAGRAAAVAASLVLVALGTEAGWHFSDSRYFRLDRYWVVVGTVSGEVRAFGDSDDDLVRRTLAAVKDAMNAGAADT